MPRRPAASTTGCTRSGYPHLTWTTQGNLTSVAEMHDTTEEYLETILELEEEGDPPAAGPPRRAARSVGRGRLRDRRPARATTATPSCATTARLRLTAKGRSLATTVVRRHRLAERLLLDVIGLEWEKVHREADRWEHAISADVEEKLVELLGDPMTCPHGNPIPGSKRRPRRRWCRSRSPTRSRARHRRPHQREARAQRRGAAPRRRGTSHPGRDAEIVGRAPGGVQVRTSAGDTMVPDAIAEQMYVSAA